MRYINIFSPFFLCPKFSSSFVPRPIPSYSPSFSLVSRSMSSVSSSQPLPDAWLHGCDGCSLPCTTHPSPPMSLLSSLSLTSSLSNTVKSYRRHLVLCQGQPHTKWPSDVSAMSYIHNFQSLLKSFSSSLSYKVILSVGEEAALNENGLPIDEEDVASVSDVYLFPECIRFKHIRRGDAEEFMQDVLVDSPIHSLSPETLAKYPHEKMEGLQLLICAHKLRDKRCGVIGPLIAQQIHTFNQDKLPEMSYASPPTPPVSSMLISHVGGHKYAGNVIVYPPGVWFGRIIACNVDRLIECFVEELMGREGEGEGEEKEKWKKMGEQARAEMEPHVRGRMLREGDKEPEKEKEEEEGKGKEQNK